MPHATKLGVDDISEVRHELWFYNYWGMSLCDPLSAVAHILWQVISFQQNILPGCRLIAKYIFATLCWGAVIPVLLLLLGKWGPEHVILPDNQLLILANIIWLLTLRHTRTAQQTFILSGQCWSMARGYQCRISANIILNVRKTCSKCTFTLLNTLCHL